MNRIAHCVLALGLAMVCALADAETRIGYVSLKVRDLERSLHFY